MHKQRRKKISKFASVAIFGLFWPFWAFLAITWDLQMLESWFWCQTSCFGMNILKKNSKIFFGPKKINFGLRGAILGTLTSLVQ